MVCGGKLICDPQLTIEANPDISGYGVIVAFVVSALLTVGAVSYAYLSDSIPEKDLSATDHQFIKDFEHMVKKLPFQNIILKFRVKGTAAQQKLSREQREEALTRFILALSDQQLATGLAILIAAISNQCSLSPPEFGAAFSLAWFSTTTHLATLDSLRQYFTQHQKLRNVRVLGIFVFMTLFFYCFVVVLAMENSPDKTSPVQCHVRGSVRLYRDEEITLSTYFVPWALTALIVLFEYKSRIFRTYEYGESDIIGLGRLSKNVLALWDCIESRKRSTLSDIDMDTWNRVREEAAREAKADRRQRLLTDIKKKLDGKTLASELFATWRYAEHQYRDSLLPLVPRMTFMLAFGLAQMIVLRVQLEHIDGIKFDTSMGFGQIIPLILLAIPFLEAAEIYYEAKGRSHSENPSRVYADPTIEAVPDSPATGVDRHSTLPLTSTDDDVEVMDLERCRSEYTDEKTLNQIKMYHYKATKNNVLDPSTATTEHEMRIVASRMRNLLNKTKVCVETEEKMKSKASRMLPVLLCIRMVFSAAAAILLNWPPKHSHHSMAGGIILTFQLLAQIARWVRQVRSTKIEDYKRLVGECGGKGGGR